MRISSSREGYASHSQRMTQGLFLRVFKATSVFCLIASLQVVSAQSANAEVVTPLSNEKSLDRMIKKSGFGPTRGLRKTPDARTLKLIEKHNEVVFRRLSRTSGLPPIGISPIGPGAPGATSAVRPFADYESAGYVFINDSFMFGSKTAKEAIAANLPKDVTLVVFMEDTSSIRADDLRKFYSTHLPADRLKLVSLVDSSEGFWARDGLPVPVMNAADDSLGVVDAKYYYPFESDKEVSGLFGDVPMTSHTFYFEGGNMMANHKGSCVIVNNRRHARIPDSIFESHYGCKSVLRLPHIDGIGHIDEHVRFVSEDTVLTDLDQYKASLEGIGLKVVMLPRPQNSIETYVNSLLVNGTVIVPTFNQTTDADAVKIYESLGLKAIGADSESLSNDGEGSIHCITMTYPPVPFEKLRNFLKLRVIE